jgi:hypothetical protein
MLLCNAQLQEEKILAVQEKLELSDQKLAQYAKLPEMEEELKQRMEALTQVRAQVGPVDSTLWTLFVCCFSCTLSAICCRTKMHFKIILKSKFFHFLRHFLVTYPWYTNLRPDSTLLTKSNLL